MKKVPILHKRWTEAIIVTLLVGILLTLFIPKFLDAQINVKITQAKSDLNRIINTVDILQQDLKDVELHSVHLFNDKLGFTRQSASFSVYSPQNKLSPVYSSKDKFTVNPDLEPLFLEILGEFPVQQLPLKFEQDKHFTPLIVNGKRVNHNFYGFRYEKLHFEKFKRLILTKLSEEDAFEKGLIDKIVPINNPQSIYYFPDVQYPPDVNTYRSMAHTPGPMLIQDYQPIPVYDPSNGMISHGILLQFTTMKSDKE